MAAWPLWNGELASTEIGYEWDTPSHWMVWFVYPVALLTARPDAWDTVTEALE